MKLAMLVRNSGVERVVVLGYRSEGLCFVRSARLASHFSCQCVNECSKWAIRPGERWLASASVIDFGERFTSDRGVAVRAVGLASCASVGGDHCRLLAVYMNFCRPFV